MCKAVVNNRVANVVLDTGSAISTVSGKFSEREGTPLEGWNGPNVTVVTGDAFGIAHALRVAINLLDFGMVGLCGVVKAFPYSLLLVMDFLSKTPSDQIS